jgi:hypothetical protein
MSAREIIAEIEALPKAEQAEVVDYVRTMCANNADANQVRYVSREKFERAKQAVFAKHAALLEKLAK